MTKREANQAIAWSVTRIAAKQASGNAKRIAANRRMPSVASSRGRKGPTRRMPAPASDALRPISQLERPYFSSASEKYG